MIETVILSYRECKCLVLSGPNSISFCHQHRQDLHTHTNTYHLCVCACLCVCIHDVRGNILAHPECDVSTKHTPTFIPDGHTITTTLTQIKKCRHNITICNKDKHMHEWTLTHTHTHTHTHTQAHKHTRHTQRTHTHLFAHIRPILSVEHHPRIKNRFIQSQFGECLVMQGRNTMGALGIVDLFSSCAPRGILFVYLFGVIKNTMMNAYYLQMNNVNGGGTGSGGERCARVYQSGWTDWRIDSSARRKAVPEIHWSWLDMGSWVFEFRGWCQWYRATHTSIYIAVFVYGNVCLIESDWVLM